MTTPPLDLFAAAKGGGNYPKPDDLEGLLLLLKPVKIETVPNRFDKDGKNPTVDRASVDTVVFEEDGTVSDYDEMFWSQVAIVNACRTALKPGNQPMILGRLVRVATKATKESLKIDDTPEAFAAARAEWLRKGGKGAEPRAVWVLAGFSDEDAARARSYLASKDPFASGE